MKKLLLSAALVAFSCLPAAAQDNNAISGSASQSQADNTAYQASISGASAIVNLPAPPVTTSSTTTQRGELETVPAMGGLALGGGHPCAYSPVTGQIVALGAGVGGGSMTVDSACMLLVAAAQAGDAQAYNAALYMMASRDRRACDAMKAAGKNIECVGRGQIVRERLAANRPAATSSKSEIKRISHQASGPLYDR